MGADYPGQEIGIKKLQNMHETAREYLCHHLRGSMNVVIGNIVLVRHYAKTGKHAADIDGLLQEAEKAAVHLLQDLKKIGC